MHGVRRKKKKKKKKPLTVTDWNHVLGIYVKKDICGQ